MTQTAAATRTPDATPTPYAAELAALHENGHALLRGALPRDRVEAERGPFLKYVVDVHRKLSAMERSLSASATQATFSLLDAPDHVRDLVCAPELGAIAARALGVPAVRILHFNGLYKPKGGVPTPWHQDRCFIPLDCPDVVTVWLPLAPVTADMAPLVFASGSHRGGGPVEMSGIEQQFALSVNDPMEPGDVSVHLGWTAHRSEPNRSDRTREAVAICYFPDGARVLSGDAGPPMMASLLQENLPGLKPGDIAQGPRTPIVFQQ